VSEEAVFECEHCGDGDALRDGESCAYCGEVKGDPNGRLIGYEYKGVGGKMWTVVGTPAWSEGNYVTIKCEDGSLSAVSAGLVRQRMQGLSTLDDLDRP
jgi:hypothetical protein